MRKRAEELVARGATPTELRAALDLPTARAQPRVQAAPKFPFLADKDLFLSRIQYAGVDYHLGTWVLGVPCCCWVWVWVWVWVWFWVWAHACVRVELWCLRRNHE